MLDDPFDTELLDIIVFNVLPTSKGNAGSPVYLADQAKENNLPRYTFDVSPFLYFILHKFSCFLLFSLLKTDNILHNNVIEKKGYWWRPERKVENNK